jgi:DNA-binding PadR family transcriptional regulator
VSLKHILLGMLDEPKSGYDLKNEFNRSLRNFWNAELSQIYPQLQKLENTGLLSSKRVPSPAGPPRRVYRRTAKGKRELLQWLQDGPDIGVDRLSYLAQVYFLHAFDDADEASRFMKNLRSIVAETLHHLESIEQEWSSCDPRYPDELPDRAFYSQLTLALGLKRLGATLEWCDESLERIETRRNRDKTRQSA